MQLPKKPPQTSIREFLLNQTGDWTPQHHAAFQEAAQSALVRGRYVHWDKLRHYKAPAWLDHTAWWLALKEARSRDLTVVPLEDLKGRFFSFNLSGGIPEHLHEIDKGAVGRVQEDAPELREVKSRERYSRHSLFVESITSSQLEGATTTRQIAVEMLHTERAPKDLSERMIANNFRAMEAIGDIASECLTRDDVLHLHALLTEDTLDASDAVGRLRKGGESVVVEDIHGKTLHTAPPAEELEDRMAAMLAFANGETPDSFVHPA